MPSFSFRLVPLSLLLIISGFVMGRATLGVIAADPAQPLSKSSVLNFDNLSESQEINLQEFMDKKLKTPANCYNPGIICKEKIEIKFVREWQPILLEDLPPDEFAKLVPKVTTALTKNSDPAEAAVAQRALALRGLLLDLKGEPVQTLGSWLHLSEMARARLSYIKGKELTDEEFVNEINGLIERMKSPGYLTKSPLPSQIDPGPGQVGYQRFNKEKKNAEQALKQTYEGPKSVTIPRKSLELDGSVKLYTKPGR